MFPPIPPLVSATAPIDMKPASDSGALRLGPMTLGSVAGSACEASISPLQLGACTGFHRAAASTSLLMLVECSGRCAAVVV